MTIDTLTAPPTAAQSRWRASVGGGADPFAYSSDPIFTWSGFARDKADAADIAFNTACLACRTLSDSPSNADAGIPPFPTSVLHVERVPTDFPNYRHTHNCQLEGSRFIRKGGSMEALCFSEEARQGQSGEDGHRLTRQIRQRVETLLTLDPAVAHTIAEGRLLQVTFYARAGVNKRLSQPYCSAGLRVHDRDEIGIPLAKATVDAILLLLLAGLWVWPCMSQRTFLYPCQPEYGLIERAQRTFLDRKEKLMERPNSYLLGTMWDMLELGHVEVATEIGAMARQALPMALLPAGASDNVVRLDRMAPAVLPPSPESLN